MAGSSDSSGSWLMTYADFITLMMIFFIVLYTLTPGVQKNKFEAIIGAFQGEKGVLRHDSVFSEEEVNIKMKRAKNWEEFQEYIRKEGLQAQVQVDLMPDGVRITLGEAVSFDTYSAELKNKARQILKKIGQNMTSYSAEDLQEIEIQGHTDDRPVKKGAVLYKTNWELGAARANSVLYFLADNTPIQPNYLKASTYGPYKPRVTNETPKGRQRNRRVVIYIRYQDAESKVRTERIKKENQENNKITELNNGTS